MEILCFTMPVINTPPHAPSERSEKLCSLCATVMDNTYPCYLLSCRHVFHNNCLDAWLSENSVCFTCGVAINKDELRVAVGTSEPQPAPSKTVPPVRYNQIQSLTQSQ